MNEGEIPQYYVDGGHEAIIASETFDDLFQREMKKRCNHKYDGGKKCTTPSIDDSEVKTAFLSAVNKLLKTKSEVIANGKEMLLLLFKTGELKAERDRLMVDALQKNIEENAHTALDQSIYQRRYDDLADRYDKLKS